MKTKIITVSFFCIATLAGYYYSTYHNTVSYPIMPTEVYEALLPKLETNNIWFKTEGGNILRFNKDDQERIIAIAGEIYNGLIPQNRSFSPAPDYLEEVKSKLEAQEISYSIKEVGGQIWVILAPEYEGRADKIFFGDI